MQYRWRWFRLPRLRSKPSLITEIGFPGMLNPQFGYLPEAIAIGDFNGDGIPDIAVIIGDPGNQFRGNLAIYLGIGDGSFEPALY